MATVGTPAPLTMGKARLFVESDESLRLYALGALIWLGFIAFILTGLFTSIKQAPLVAIPFFGVFLWIGGWKAGRMLLGSVRAYVNFGTVRLALERAPTLGGELRGAVEFESGAAALSKLDAELVCKGMIAGRKPGRNVPDPVVIHSEKAQLAMHLEPGHKHAVFAFAIPGDARASGDEEPSADPDLSQTYIWKLKLSAPNANGDLARSFTLQVLPAGTPEAEATSQQPAPESGIALVVANLIPLAMVFLGLGSVGGLVVLYWAENVVIGFYTVLRMLESGRGSAADKIGQTLFFCVHYGMFCFVHGVFVTALFLSPEQQAVRRALPRGDSFVAELWHGAQAVGLFSPAGLLLPLIALIASHGVSFYTNYMRNGRYLTSLASDSFWRPYPRMVVLHVFILAGGFFIASHGSTMLPLAALVIGKTLMDLLLHRRSNRAG